MADTTTTERPNTVSIIDAGPSRKKVAIEIPAETVAEKLRESIDTLAVEAELPGFRRGRAPRRLVERRFGSSVRTEAKNQLVAAAYTKAVEDHKLKVIGEPSSESLPTAELEDGKPFAFELEVEVLPDFTLPNLDGVDVRKPVLDITDEMVGEEVRKIAVNEGALESRDAPEPGDYITGHAVMTGPDGAEFHNINGAVVQVPAPEKEGKGMILGIMVDDFDRQLGRPTVGQTVTIKAKGPENHEVEAIRNVDLTITFKVDRVDRIVPSPIDDLVARFGMESESQLRDAVRTRMDQRAMIQQQSVMRQQVAQYLIDSTRIDLPERATAVQAARTLERHRAELMYRGVEPQRIEERMAEFRAASHEVAVRELKLFFILNRVAEDMNISVQEAEINGRIAQMAMERNVRPEKLRQELIQQNRVSFIYQQIREHKAMDTILAKAKFTEMPAEEFNRVMKEEAEGKQKA